MKTICFGFFVSWIRLMKNYERVLMGGGNGHGSKRKSLDFGGDLDSFVNPGSLSTILYH